MTKGQLVRVLATVPDDATVFIQGHRLRFVAHSDCGPDKIWFDRADAERYKSAHYRVLYDLDGLKPQVSFDGRTYRYGRCCMDVTRDGISYPVWVDDSSNPTAWEDAPRTPADDDAYAILVDTIYEQMFHTWDE
jgi:hypothetical protein